MKYAVRIEIDHNEFMYVRDVLDPTYSVEPLPMDTREQAELVAGQWNTGEVVELKGDMYDD